MLGGLKTSLTKGKDNANIVRMVFRCCLHKGAARRLLIKVYKIFFEIKNNLLLAPKKD